MVKTYGRKMVEAMRVDRLRYVRMGEATEEADEVTNANNIFRLFGSITFSIS